MDLVGCWVLRFLLVVLLWFCIAGKPFARVDARNLLRACTRVSRW